MRVREYACRPSESAPAVDVTMKFHELDRLADHVVLPGLASVIARGCANTAETLAYIAIADERKLYLQAAYSCMYKYCLGELHMSEDAAFKRIQAARAARGFPALFDAVESGRLHLGAVVLLAPHLTREIAAELVRAATHKTKAQIEALLAERFPRPDVPALVMAIAPTSVTSDRGHEPACEPSPPLAPGQVNVLDVQGVPASVPQVAPRARVTPLAPQRFALQVTIDQKTHDKLRRAKELLAHAVPSGDVAEVLDRALGALIEQLERRRCAATDRPRPRRSSADGRHIRADVKREVARRDGGQCTFVSEKGRRCEERGRMEFDHIHPVARGGRSTVVNLRLRCHAHNQHAADLVYGAGLMNEKRSAARGRAAEAKARKVAPDAARPRSLPSEIPAVGRFASRG
jgi:5-methylcytosine-specific restriction endonuclease McrA